MIKGPTFLFILFLLLPFLALQSKAYGNEEIKIVSLYWPPYSGKDLPDQGTSLKIIRDHFATKGISVSYSFMPWNRALKLYEAGVFDAIAPEYFGISRQRTCHFSTPFQYAPLGFSVIKGREFKWDKLEDLGAYKIGTVSGYLNTPEFDFLVEQNKLTTEAVPDDVTNITKVGKQRIPLAIIDKNVLQYLLENTPRLEPYKNKVTFNQQVLSNNSLHICFQKNAIGARFKRLFDDAVTTAKGS